jgi:demethylmenaquinone methyltransferase/2-methoxy-6-polyprenyl-1,4-benzoquinol methylase
VTYQWVDCDRHTVSRRYDRISRFIPLIDRVFFLPRGLRRQATDHLGLSRGDSVLEIGCGTGNSFAYLHDAVGPAGHVHGIDISSGMLARARARCDANHWHNIELVECDAAEYTAPAPLDGVLFSLSYNTMPHHRAVLRKAWEQLRPGGRLVIMDAKLPSGPAAKLLLPFSLWLMKHTMLGNPLIQPWQELAAIAEHCDMSECLFSSYYICGATKPLVCTKPRDRARASNDNFYAGLDVEPAHRIAAE